MNTAVDFAAASEISQCLALLVVPLLGVLAVSGQEKVPSDLSRQ
jgi:hypothetical protein